MDIASCAFILQNRYIVTKGSDRTVQMQQYLKDLERKQTFSLVFIV